MSATSRLSFVSRARNTCPIPPSPIGAVISYTPRRAPGARAKLLWSSLPHVTLVLPDQKSNGALILIAALYLWGRFDARSAADVHAVEAFMRILPVEKRNGGRV